MHSVVPLVYIKYVNSVRLSRKTYTVTSRKTKHLMLFRETVLTMKITRYTQIYAWKNAEFLNAYDTDLHTVE